MKYLRGGRERGRESPACRPFTLSLLPSEWRPPACIHRGASLMRAEGPANRLPLVETRCRGLYCCGAGRLLTSPWSRTRRKGHGRIFVAPRSESLGVNGEKVANLSAKHRESIRLPDYSDGNGRSARISEFLSHPSGVEAILNTRALQSVERLETNTYRCTLPAIQFLQFEVLPEIVLRVTSASDECIVEMLSCQFRGAESLEQQSHRFSAAMRNHITWDENAAEPFVSFDVDLNVELEVAAANLAFSWGFADPATRSFTGLHAAVHVAADIRGGGAGEPDRAGIDRQTRSPAGGAAAPGLPELGRGAPLKGMARHSHWPPVSLRRRRWEAEAAQGVRTMSHHKTNEKLEVNAVGMSVRAADGDRSGDRNPPRQRPPARWGDVGEPTDHSRTGRA